LPFYVGLVYNILLVIEREMNSLFEDSSKIDFSHSYLVNNIFPILQAIDSRLESPAHSLLYLPINCMIAYNPKPKNHISEKSMLVSCLRHYYSINAASSKLFQLLTKSGWFPQEAKPTVPLSSVLRFELTDVVNPIYQLKYIGNMYLNLQDLKLEPIQQSK
jgi:hypothetical protein